MPGSSASEQPCSPGALTANTGLGKTPHMPKVTALTIYPVKSLRGISLETAELTARGLRHDRRWMLINSRGRFLTQRDLPRLSLVDQVLCADGARLSMPGKGEVLLPFEDRAGARSRTAVWGDECEVEAVGEAASAWLTAAMDSPEPLQLVRMVAGYVRPQRHPDLMGAATSTHFADGAPYLVANVHSLDALNAELVNRGLDPVAMHRFRPNVVIDGLPAFAEHAVGELQGSDYSLRLCYPCERCVVTTIDPGTGIPDAARQPFLTLREINPFPGRRGPAFAQNSALAVGEGRTIRVGDSLRWMASG